MYKGWIILAACVALVVVLVGCVGDSCVDECTNAGNSSQRCFDICRP